MGKNIIIVGGFHEIIELCEELKYNIVGIIDNKLKEKYLGYPIIGNDSDASMLFKTFYNLPLVITPDTPLLREKLFGYYSKIGFRFETIISAKAKISKSAQIGTGTIIQSGVNVSAQTRIGNFVKLNTNCNVMHDCLIHDYVTIAPNAVLLGHVTVSKKVYIGANSTILPTISIGEDSLVGAGSVVTRNIDNNITVKGVPAK